MCWSYFQSLVLVCKFALIAHILSKRQLDNIVFYLLRSERVCAALFQNFETLPQARGWTWPDCVADSPAAVKPVMPFVELSSAELSWPISDGVLSSAESVISAVSSVAPIVGREEGVASKTVLKQESLLCKQTRLT